MNKPTKEQIISIAYDLGAMPEQMTDAALVRICHAMFHLGAKQQSYRDAIPCIGCDYLSPTDMICTKCGRAHTINALIEVVRAQADHSVEAAPAACPACGGKGRRKHPDHPVPDFEHGCARCCATGKVILRNADAKRN